VQPAQQQGRRIPPLSFESAFLIRIPLVSSFLPETTQQIHSLRASGVMSSHTARAAGVSIRALRKSSGILCTTPPAGSFRVIGFILSNPFADVWYLPAQAGDVGTIIDTLFQTPSTY